MSSSFSGNPNNILPTTYIIPEDPSEKDLMLRQYLNSIAMATNSKDSGIYDSNETVTGQKFLPTFSTNTSSNANYRGVLRKVVDFGAIPSSASSTVAHGITTTENFSFVKIYACATDPGVSTVNASIPIPYINTATPSDSVEISVDATNVIITTTTANYASYTRCFVILEWITVI